MTGMETKASTAGSAIFPIGRPGAAIPRAHNMIPRA